MATAVAMLASAALLLTCAEYWTLMDQLAFLAPVFGLAVFALFALVAIGSLLFFLFALRSRRTRWAWLPLAIQLAAFLLQSQVNWTQNWLAADFSSRLEGRLELIRQIERGEVTDTWISGRTDLSRSGVIHVTRRGDTVSVFFYTWRGVLDSFAGYLYCSEPGGTPDAPSGFYREWRRLDEHWCWFSAR